MIRTFKYPLRPTAQQRSIFEQWLGLCCDLYNAGLEQRITWYCKAGKSITLYEQQSQFTELRNTESEFSTLPVDVGRSALRRLDEAFRGFFRRVKAKTSKAGFPRFRSRTRYNSFKFWHIPVRISDTDSRNAWVRVPRLGLVRFRMHRPMVGAVREATIIKDTRGRWFICLACDIGEAPPKRMVETAIGIDLGVTAFATLSDGNEIKNPRYFQQHESSLVRAQRIYTRKSRNSKSKQKARQTIARIHARIRNCRREFHYKTARSLVDCYDLIVHETLNIAGLMFGNVSKSIHDVGWGTFLRILHSKAEEAGVHVIAVDPRNTSQMCSGCGTIVPKKLSQRVHECACGCVLGRDHNAAINVLARGLRAVPGLATAQVTGPELL